MTSGSFTMMAASGAHDLAQINEVKVTPTQGKHPKKQQHEAAQHQPHEKQQHEAAQHLPGALPQEAVVAGSQLEQHQAGTKGSFGGALMTSGSFTMMAASGDHDLAQINEVK